MTETERNTLRLAILELGKLVANLKAGRQEQELRELRRLRQSVESSVLKFRERRP